MQCFNQTKFKFFSKQKKENNSTFIIDFLVRNINSNTTNKKSTPFFLISDTKKIIHLFSKRKKKLEILLFIQTKKTNF